MWRHFSCLCACLSLVGCAAATPTSRPVSIAGRDGISAAEIVASHVTDAYQAVLQLRPEFLRRSGVTVLPSPVAPRVIVYLDGLEFGTAESLRNVPLGRVRIIRYLRPNEADLRWGGQHPAGAIDVITLKQGEGIGARAGQKGWPRRAAP